MNHKNSCVERARQEKQRAYEAGIRLAQQGLFDSITELENPDGQ